MGFFGKIAGLVKMFAMKALEIALQGVPGNKVEKLIDYAKLVISIVEDLFPGQGRGEEKYKAALNALLRYAAQEGIKLLEFQAETLIQNAFSTTLGAEKLKTPTPPEPPQ